jgi:hypothetical protein
MRFRTSILPTLSLLAIVVGTRETVIWRYDNLHGWLIVAAGLLGFYYADLCRFNQASAKAMETDR